jgi:N-acetylneuraminic acid mutarotase
MLVSTSTRPRSDGTPAANPLAAVHKALLSVVLSSTFAVGCLSQSAAPKEEPQPITPAAEPAGEQPEDETPEAPTQTSSWSALAQAPIAGRSAHAAVWTGASMVVAFGVGDEGALADGARFDPETSSWSKLATPPIGARFMPLSTAVPGGAFVGFGASREGARPADAAVWMESTRSWTKLPASQLAGRTSAAIVANDRAIVIWGGETDSGFVADGARFDLKTNTWSKLAASPLSARAFHRGELSGNKMIVYGGIDSAGKILADSASYDLDTDTWTALDVPMSIGGRADAVAVGNFFYGGRELPDGDDGCPHARVDGLSFSAGAFEAIPASPLTPRADSAAWAANGSLFVFGGFACDRISGDGAVYDGKSKSWSMLPKGGPSARRGATAVWTGEEAIVWGGTDETLASLADGARFRP